jgi:hypothetical protein
MVTWCMKFYLCKTNDVDLAIYKSIERVDYYQSKELVYKNNPGYRKSCSVKFFEEHTV